MKKIILASTSPRRKLLLEQAGLDFEVLAPDCDEDAQLLPPAEYVMELSRIKSAAAAKKTGEDALVIGADTIVYHNGQILGKPKDAEEACEMLRSLSADTHEVYTGVTITDTADGRVKSFYECTRVTFYPEDEEEIRAYIRTGEPLDKAGAYGIQGRGVFLAEKIEGDYCNVVGLPVARLLREIKDML